MVENIYREYIESPKNFSPYMSAKWSTHLRLWYPYRYVLVGDRLLNYDGIEQWCLENFENDFFLTSESISCISEIDCMAFKLRWA